MKTAPVARPELDVQMEISGESGLRLVHKGGFLVFRGKLLPDEIPDHRDIREERIDVLVSTVLGNGRD